MYDHLNRNLVCTIRSRELKPTLFKVFLEEVDAE